LLDANVIKGLAHVTGGGLVDNIPRILPAGVGVEIRLDAWDVPPIFKFMQRLGNVPEREMFRTFNMGVGMVIICAGADVGRITSHVGAQGETCRRIGRVVAGACEVSFA
jgi:phosphoribosylformylglycinamidine cyclo-ligase